MKHFLRLNKASVSKRMAAAPSSTLFPLLPQVTEITLSLQNSDTIAALPTTSMSTFKLHLRWVLIQFLRLGQAENRNEFLRFVC